MSAETIVEWSDLDIKGFFDNIPHDLLIESSRKQLSNKVELLYLE